MASLAKKFAGMSGKTSTFGKGALQRSLQRPSPPPLTTVDKALIAELNALQIATTPVSHNVAVLSNAEVQYLGQDNKHLKGLRNYKPSNVFQGTIPHCSPRKPKASKPKATAGRKMGNAAQTGGVAKRPAQPRCPRKPKAAAEAAGAAAKQEQQTNAIMTELVSMGVGQQRPTPPLDVAHPADASASAAPTTHTEQDSAHFLSVDVVSREAGEQGPTLPLPDASLEELLILEMSKLGIHMDEDEPEKADTPMEDMSGSGSEDLEMSDDISEPSTISTDREMGYIIRPVADTVVDDDESDMSVEDDSEWELELALHRAFKKQRTC
ncbi:hypothetical protein VHEMI00069 [[Torrubiella] hemipterigena]|uniref:Uncharacterized protein n=1 Tax=[Torrubiella] hemipterigena TaxID=1531966 RepID=A0A0A1T3C7_9HYPO|nr:hypothetical protein VHEMI00069 [[Torrubiella] hemipterigena]